MNRQLTCIFEVNEMGNKKLSWSGLSILIQYSYPKNVSIIDNNCLQTHDMPFVLIASYTYIVRTHRL